MVPTSDADMVEDNLISVVSKSARGSVPVVVARALDPLGRKPKIPRGVLMEMGSVPGAQAELNKYKYSKRSTKRKGGKGGSGGAGGSGGKGEGADGSGGADDDSESEEAASARQQMEELVSFASKTAESGPAMRRAQDMRLFRLRSVADYLTPEKLVKRNETAQLQEHERAALNAKREENIRKRQEAREERERQRMAEVRARKEVENRDREFLIAESRAELAAVREAKAAEQRRREELNGLREQVFLEMARKRYQARMDYIIARRKEALAVQNRVTLFTKRLREQMEQIRLADMRARKVQDMENKVARRREAAIARRERRRKDRVLRRLEDQARRAELGIRPAFMLFEVDSSRERRKRQRDLVYAEKVAQEKRLARELRLSRALVEESIELEEAEKAEVRTEAQTIALMLEGGETEEQYDARVQRELQRRQRKLIAGETMLFKGLRRSDLLGLKRNLVEQAKDRQSRDSRFALTDTQLAALREREAEVDSARALSALEDMRARRLALKERLRQSRFMKYLRRLQGERDQFIERFGAKGFVEAMRWHFLGLQTVALPKQLLAKLEKLAVAAPAKDLRLEALKENPSYKTVLCLFKTKLACPHGKYCPFAHGEVELEERDTEWITW
jgi:hypothetical protein